jgi:hypothetical protein
MSLMNPPTADDKSRTFNAVLIRQYSIGTFSFAHGGGDSLFGPPEVTVELLPREVVITDVPGRPSDQWIGDGRTIRYYEIKVAQLVRNSRIYLARAPSPHLMPLAVRLYLGESRSHVILFTSEHDGLMEALESHGVPVERHPRTLGFMLFGRR